MADSDDDDIRDEEDDEMIFMSHSHSPNKSPSLRSRLFGFANGSPKVRDRLICTTPGHIGAGETETEADEPPHRLPTSRKKSLSSPLVPPNTLQQSLTPLLFESSRLLSIVPAVVGAIYNIYLFSQPPTSRINGRAPPERVDYFISALWAILTGWQCLCLTTGLLTRWRHYYPPLATLIRLLALQAICWPATHLTLSILEHDKRPVIVWTIVGTTTCASRSVQIWVTSNLWQEPKKDGPVVNGKISPEESRSLRWRGGKWGGRRWDWTAVGVRCMLPAGVLYFLMAWAEQLRREWSGC